MVARNLADPPDLPPERLWRSLLPLRPERRLRARLRDAAHIPLIVRAIPAMAEQLARDAGLEAAGDVEQLQERLADHEVLIRVLHTPAGLAFPSLAALGALESHELAPLTRETRAALADISPTTARSNGRAWREALTAGARHADNVAEADVLASCVDVTPNGGFLPRPDRYWGIPLSALLDGHWMAYQAARDVAKDRRR